MDKIKIYINNEQVGSCESIEILTDTLAEIKNLDYNDDFIAAIFGDQAADSPAAGNTEWTDKFTTAVKHLPVKKINLLIEDSTIIPKKSYLLLGCIFTSIEEEFPREDYYSSLFRLEFETMVTRESWEKLETLGVLNKGTEKSEVMKEKINTVILSSKEKRYFELLGENYYRDNLILQLMLQCAEKMHQWCAKNNLLNREVNGIISSYKAAIREKMKEDEEERKRR